MHEQLNQELIDQRETALREAVWERVPIANGPHVWVGTVADVEAFRPRGRWLMANQPVEELQRDIRELVQRQATKRTTADPRWAIYAQHGFGRHAPDAATPLSGIVERARLAREDVRAFNAWASLSNEDPKQMARFYDRYLGRYDQLRDWLNIEVDRAGWDQLLDRVVPTGLRLHVEINLDSLQHELLATDAVLAAPDAESNGVFVFRNCSKGEYENALYDCSSNQNDI